MAEEKPEEKKGIKAIAAAAAQKIWKTLHGGEQASAEPNLLDKDTAEKMAVITKEIEDSLRAARVYEEGERMLKSIKPQQQKPFGDRVKDGRDAQGQQQQQ